MKRPLLALFLILTAWKIVRTDWVVVCAWYTDGSIQCAGSSCGYHDAFYRPSVSPAWSPPHRMEYGPVLKSFGSGASFPVGEPRLRPDWLLIGLKIGLPLLIMISANALRWLFGKRKCLFGVVHELMAESKRQRERR